MMTKICRNFTTIGLVSINARLLIAVAFLGIGCTAAQWSRFLHNKTLIDNGTLLLPTIWDIITGDEGVYAHDRPFGQVILTAPQKLLPGEEQATDEAITSAVLAYFRQYAGGYPIEFVEDYTRRVGDTVSMCFSQAVNGTRIYGTAACADVHHGDLRSAWHLFVVPPSICTEPRVSSEQACGVALSHVKSASTSQPVTPELNITYVDRVPTLVWRVPVPTTDGNRTYFIDANSGELTAITTAAYRQTDGAKEPQGQTAGLETEQKGKG
jgi:hypothetical protein